MKAKRPFVFFFADQPQFAGPDSREHTAHLFKAYRAHPERYQFKRIDRHAYSVKVRGSDALAIMALSLL